MDKAEMQYLTAMLGDLFDSLRRLSADVARIAEATEARTEIERQRLDHERYDVSKDYVL